MMKKYILLLSIPLLFAVGCSDNLDLNPLNVPSKATYFTNANDFELFVNSTYYWNMPGADDYSFDYASDFCVAARSHIGSHVLITGNLMPNSGIVGKYFDYIPIRHAYEYFNAIANFDGIPADQKAQLDGQVYYMLAYRYFAMFRAYENVPVVTELLELENSDVPSSDKTAVFAEAVKNVDLAINNLPSVRSERGRLTKLAALTLKADMLLYTASRFDETINGATYSTALTAANAALAEADAQGYGLAESYPGLFLASQQSSEDAQKEIILENVMLKGILTGFRVQDNGSQILADKFPCTDGLPINESPLYDPQHPFKNRDPRLGYTLQYPGSIVSYVDGGNPDRIFNSLDPNSPIIGEYILSTDLDSKLSGYATQKYWDREVGDFDDYTSYVIYRYADLLLMAAEAENEVSGPSATVFNRLSRLRQRVDLPALNESKYSSQAEVRDLIRNERAIELAWEGKRYWDLRRWGTAETALNTIMKSLNIKSYNPDGTFKSYVDQIYVRTDVEDPTQESLFDIPDGSMGGRTMATYVFDAPKHYVWPIPESVIIESDVIEQHPLWK